MGLWAPATREHLRRLIDAGFVDSETFPSEAKGGLVRASWDDASEIVAAAHVHPIKKYGPALVAGSSPIPAVSIVSHDVGSRFTPRLGGTMLSFYDWYADLPVASPQVFGDQTNVLQSADWWNSSYLIMWGSNVPVTRTPERMTHSRWLWATWCSKSFWSTFLISASPPPKRTSKLGYPVLSQRAA